MSRNAAWHITKAWGIIFSASFLRPSMSEWALINMIPHAESNQSDNTSLHLTFDGYNRAEYISRCLSGSQPNLAFPLGHPTALLASMSPVSVQPRETLEPLGRELGLPVRNEIKLSDVEGFAKYVQRNLHHGETWLVAWQHWFIPLIAKQMDPNGLADAHFPFPKKCTYTEWKEPSYTQKTCYDLLSQLMLFRKNANHPWRIEAYTDMHMGFGGHRNSSCESSFYPNSNPTSWNAAALRERADQNDVMNKAIAGICVIALILGIGSFISKQVPLKVVSSSYHEHLLLSNGYGVDNNFTTRSKSNWRGSLFILITICMVTIILLVAIYHVDVTKLGLLMMKMLPMSFLFNFCAGGFVGALAETIAAPIERVKLLIQTQDTIPSIASGEMPRYKGIIDCASRIYREEGLTSFWRGNFPNVLRYFPLAAFNFAFKDEIEGLFPRYDAHAEFVQLLLANLASGGLAGAGSLTLVYPLDYARTRLAGDIGMDNWHELPKACQDSSRKRQFEGLWDCLMKTIRSEGFFALYKGYFVSVIGIFFYRAPYFGLFDTLNALNPYSMKHGTGTWGTYFLRLLISYLLAHITFSIAAFVSYPFDAVRRRLQMEADKGVQDRQYKNGLHCAYMIIVTEGMSGFYKGFLANLIRGASAAIMLTLFKEITALAGTD